jgi:hypothetical protein
MPRSTKSNSHERKEHVRIEPEVLHALSNQLSVILGFVEIVIGQTPTDDPRRGDLLEIRDAAVAAAELIGRSPGKI